MLNRSASLAMSTCVLKALPGKLDIKRHSPSILYLLLNCFSRITNFIHVIWLLSIWKPVLLDFSLTVKAATLISISGRG